MSEEPVDVCVDDIREQLKPVNKKEEVERLHHLLDRIEERELKNPHKFRGNHMISCFQRIIQESTLAVHVDENGDRYTMEVGDEAAPVGRTVYSCNCGKRFKSKKEAEDHLLDEGKPMN